MCHPISFIQKPNGDIYHCHPELFGEESQFMGIAVRGKAVEGQADRHSAIAKAHDLDGDGLCYETSYGPARPGLVLEEPSYNDPDPRLVGIATLWFRSKNMKNLTRANLSWADLSAADLREADLRWANLTRASLSRADLRWANLREADLTRADLTRADLREASLDGANLSWADLREADLREADLRGADLSRAYLTRANLRWADWDESTIWPTGFTPPENIPTKGDQDNDTNT